MDLQSHFGSDERFRMDSRFLESDSEEEQKGNYLTVKARDVRSHLVFLLHLTMEETVL